jgi:hypothetical protein
MVIREVHGARDKNRFIKFPWQIYRNDRHWVPPLILERRDLLNRRANPFFEHARMKLLLAAGEDGAVLGRIAAIVNTRHIETHNEKAGFFGLFESIDDQAVADALFSGAAAYLRAEGMEIMRGPENLSVNDDIGLLVEGFDTPPMIMMPHNPPYYERLVEGFGCRKAMDLFAYHCDIREEAIAEGMQRGAEIMKRRRNKFTIRPLRMNDFAAELRRIHAIYTSAWEENWGAVAMTPAEFNHLAKALKMVIDPDLCLIAEVDGEPAGFSLALPDFNQVLRRLNGRLLPFGLLKLLYYRRRIDALRVVTMGVIKKFRGLGIDACFYHESFLRAKARGLWHAEMSWILENNEPMNRILRNIGFRLYKTYRLYDFPLR